MHLLTNLAASQPIAYAILILSFLALAGLSLGEIQVRGIKLGVAGVLFAGIVFGHFHLTLPPETLGFVRELGLILFVYTIGLQVGPGFFTSFRKQGLPLNLLALTVVLGGAALTVLMAWIGHIDMAAAVGIFSGATTNTPSLGAAQEALKQALGSDLSRAGLPALGYAAAYPFGIIGIVLSMLLLRSFLRIRPQEELKAFEREQERMHASLQRMNIRVINANLSGLHLHEIPGREALGVVVSRIKYIGDSEVSVANADTTLHVGDVMLAVGTPAHLREFCLIVGEESPQDLMEFPGPVTFERCVVTRKDLLGKTLRQLHFTEQYGVTVTRVLRGDVELSAVPNITLQFGDLLQVVGRAEDLRKVAALVGNSIKELNHTNFISMFLGIGLGVLLGLWPFSFGNMPMPVRLGLAGGPLLAAIVLSRLGRIGPLVWYMPPNANLALRQFGITLFLACAGLKAGEHFVEVLVTGQGPLWMAAGAVITLLPLLGVALLGRWLLRLNFVTLCGLLAGSMTDPPALAFASTVNKSDAPALAYATVYPLSMLLRIVAAQALVVFFVR